jgi:hypothetical protein
LLSPVVSIAGGGPVGERLAGVTDRSAMGSPGLVDADRDPDVDPEADTGR